MESIYGLNEKMDEDLQMVYLIDCDKFRNRVKKAVGIESEKEEEPEFALDSVQEIEVFRITPEVGA